MSNSRRAFTLFEVALSLALVSFGVISVLMLLPTGIKAQQMARYQILASAKALEMVEAFNTTHNANPAADVEANAPWNVHTNAKNLQPDLESKVSSYRFGMFPLPNDIAKRLDSDGDEIQQVLASGGQLYYSQPLATTGIQESGFAPSAPPNEAQRLIIAVVGYPQNNALLYLPEKSWPYYTVYPSPPAHVIRRSDADTNNLAYFSSLYGYQPMLWEDLDLRPGAYDVEMREVWKAYHAYVTIAPSARPISYIIPPAVPSPEDLALKPAAKNYADKIVEWCLANGVPSACYDGLSTLTDFPSATNQHLQVTAARLMAHAGPIMLANNEITTTSGTVTFSADTVQRMHENAMFLGTQFAARYPYDWGTPRPLQRAIMMDHPLIEYDLLSPPRLGKIFGSTEDATQWKPVTPFPVVNAGVSMTYPKLGTPAFWSSLWGPSVNSTLTAPFDSAERCRQIVFWAVDWQSYEDFETAPSAPVDAGRYHKAAPRPGASFATLCGGPRWMDHHLFGYRNPEKMIVFNSDMSAVATGTPTPPGKSNVIGTHGPDNFGGQTNDQGLGVATMSRFLGLWGADRNANKQLDRGTVPRSTRMRALTVARFNYYDRRVHATIR